MSDDEKIVKLGVTFRDPDAKDEPFLKVVSPYDKGACRHDGSFLIREGNAEVECTKCGEKVEPMFVINMLATQETRWHLHKDRYKDEMKRLYERKRTKCIHCGQMTPISRN